MDKHTPTPWAFGDIEPTAIVTTSGIVVHRPHSQNEFEPADLAFIVKTVNAYDLMHRALTEILDVDKASMSADGVNRAISIARVALSRC